MEHEETMRLIGSIAQSFNKTPLIQCKGILSVLTRYTNIGSVTIELKFNLLVGNTV